MTTRDEHFMRQALELAERGRGRTSPNPRVGAVVVRDGVVVGRGYHASYGGPHAEVHAIADAGERVAGADLYVTLEPCCVWGRTPPCTEAIIGAGIARTVVSIVDPNPEVSGRGLEALRAAGVRVELGCLDEDATALNAAYLAFRRTGLPLVTLKLAVTLDGRLTVGASPDRWITGEAARRRVHEMRSGVDAVMVGVGTVLADDPELTDRREEAKERQPARIVLDSDLRTPAESRLAASARKQRTIVACTAEGAGGASRALLERSGVEIWTMPADRNGRTDAGSVLRRAAEEGMIDILCEGGAKLATTLISSGLAGRLAAFIAPKLGGDGEVPAVRDLTRPVGLFEPQWSRLGDDVLLTARFGTPQDDEQTAHREEAKAACSQD